MKQPQSGYNKGGFHIKPVEFLDVEIVTLHYEMVEQTGGEETDEGFKELLSRIEVNCAVKQAGKKQRNKNQHRPSRQSEFYKKEWKVCNEYQISEVELEYVL